MLYTNVQDLKLNYISHIVHWKGLKSFNSEIARFREEAKSIYENLAGRLIENELLTQDEASRLKPDISVNVADGRRNKSVPLPGASNQ